MKLIKILSDNFDPAYVQPRVVARAARQLVPVQSMNLNRPPYQGPANRRMSQRRLQHRRQQQHKVLLDLRAPRSRRKSPGRRHSDYGPGSGGQYGIDTYA